MDPATNTWHASFYAYDGHGNVRFLTNESGQVTDTYVFDAFGTLITATGTTNNRYLYTGEQFDPNLGLYYLRARLMNPLTGRFWSMDSYEGENADPASLHKYLYTSADPVNGSDPSGHETTLTGTQVTAGLIVATAAYAVFSTTHYGVKANQALGTLIWITVARSVQAAAQAIDDLVLDSRNRHTEGVVDGLLDHAWICSDRRPARSPRWMETRS